MPQNYLLPSVDGPIISIPSTVMLREKWMGAMLDATGRAYSGALRLDFSPDCVQEEAWDAVADTLARYPILAASFKYDNDTVVGHAPTESKLRLALREHLETGHQGVTNESFLAYRARHTSDPGLRLASVRDDSGLHIWIGFWIFTCDGASIDLIVDEITKRYTGVPVTHHPLEWTEYASLENSYAKERTELSRDMTDVYLAEGPYGMDNIRATPRGSTGRMQSVPFHTNILRQTVLASSKAYRVTPFTLLFAAYQQAVSAVSGTSRVITGVPLVNRRRPEDYTVVGPISNTVPIPTQHDLKGSIKETVKSIQLSVIKATERQHIEPAALYPKGITPRTAAYELPYPQLFNAWNSQRVHSRISLGQTEWMTVNLLPNSTCRVGFEMTLDEQSESISGRMDMDLDAYEGRATQVAGHMVEELNKFILNA